MLLKDICYLEISPACSISSNLHLLMKTKESLTAWHLTLWIKMAVYNYLCGNIICMNPAQSDHIWIYKKQWGIIVSLEEVAQWQVYSWIITVQLKTNGVFMSLSLNLTFPSPFRNSYYYWCYRGPYFAHSKVYFSNIIVLELFTFEILKHYAPFFLSLINYFHVLT